MIDLSGIRFNINQNAKFPSKRRLDDKFSEYESRNARLRWLGFSTYADYLASELWSRIRAEVIRLADGKCFCCGAKATQAHHTNYKIGTLNGESLAGIQAVCRDCHTRIELHEDGRKTKTKEVAARTIELQKANGVVPKWKCRHCLKNFAKRGRDICGPCLKTTAGRSVEHTQRPQDSIQRKNTAVIAQR